MQKHSKRKLLTIDGAMGEGGGQILRSSLALSLCLGKPFYMTKVRATRKKPGLQPQHLAALKVKADPVDDFDVARAFARWIDRGTNFQVTYLEKRFNSHQPRPPLSDVVRLRIQSATRLIEIHKVAMA